MTVKTQLRRLETLGRPVVAAMNGTALGGGLEIGLACHHRIGLDAKGVVYGLPEVTLGLLPGGGGVVRIIRMLGIANGFMNVLAQGQRHKPAEGAGGRDRRRAGRRARRRCSTRRGPGSRPTPRPRSRGTSRATRSPAARRPARSSPRSCRRSRPTCASSSRARRCRRRATSCAAAVEGAQVDIDTAFRIEAPLLHRAGHRPGGEEHDQGVLLRPAGTSTAAAPGRTATRRGSPRKVAVLGAGMMGAGIAYVCALAGWEVVLKDVSAGGGARRARPTPRAWSRRASSAGRPRRRRARRCSRGSPRPTTTTTSPAATSSSRRCSSPSSSSSRCSGRR